MNTNRKSSTNRKINEYAAINPVPAADTKIISFLLDNKEMPHTIRAIALATGLNYRIAHGHVNALEKEGVIKTTATGNSRLCVICENGSNKLYEAEYARREALCQNKDVLVLRRRLEALPSCFIALLFGSHVKGTATPHSDIDILVIADDATLVETELSLWPEKIHLTTLRSKDAIELMRRKDYNVLAEAHKKGVILVGIEDYQRLLAHARREKNKGSGT